MQDVNGADLHAARGVAPRAFELNPGFGTADDLPCVDGKACGVVEATEQGVTLTCFEAQSCRHADQVPAARRKPDYLSSLPFSLLAVDRK